MFLKLNLNKKKAIQTTSRSNSTEIKTFDLKLLKKIEPPSNNKLWHYHADYNSIKYLNWINYIENTSNV